MPYDSKNQQEENERAVATPQPGDYWQEMFCPYFIVVDVNLSKVTVLSCLGGPDSYNRKHELNAKVEVDGSHWAFDYGKEMVVDREWIEKAVKYGTIDGFVADVVRSEKTIKIVEEWRKFKANEIKRKIKDLENEWESFTGWKYLKEESV